MGIEANKHGSREDPIMTKENSDNKPGLALFTLEYRTYDETYTYITVLPYKGKLRGRIQRITEEAALITRPSDDVYPSDFIYVETLDFDTYAEAKAAAQGATFMDVEENAGMSPIGEVDAEKLQKAIEIMERIKGETQLTGDNSQDKKNLRNAVLAADCETGLWYNVND